MMEPNTRREAIALYDRFAHDGRTGRLFMRRMVASCRQHRGGRGADRVDLSLSPRRPR